MHSLPQNKLGVFHSLHMNYRTWTVPLQLWVPWLGVVGIRKPEYRQSAQPSSHLGALISLTIPDIPYTFLATFFVHLRI